MKKILFLILVLICFLMPPRVRADDTVLVTAAVQPTATDVELSISSSRSDLLNEGDTVTFTINYRAVPSDVYPFTLTATWNKGTIEDGNTVDVFEYIIGSASKTDDNVSPVVDLQNKTITWDIPGLQPSSSPHHVSFDLHVMSLPTDKLISVDTKASGIYNSTIIPEVVYRSHVKRQPEKFPTGLPGPTSPPPTPTPVIPPLIIRSVKIREITNESITFDTTINEPTYVTVYYGSCQGLLSEMVKDDFLSYDHHLQIENLQADTIYCFQIFAQDADRKRSVRSDKFSFLTAKERERFKIKQEFVTWNNLPLNFNTLGKIIIPPKETIVVHVQMEETQSIKEITGKFEKTSVLGATTITSPHVGEVRLFEVSAGVFSGEIATPEQNGEYNFVLDIKDDNNAYTQRTLSSDFVIVPPMKVIEEKTDRPIENAAVNIYRFEESSKSYVSLQESFSLPQTENGVIFPYRSDEHGDVNIALPEGKYRFDVTAIGYEDAQGSVYLGVDDLAYPVIKMKKQSSFFASMNYLFFAIGRALKVLWFYLNKFFSTQLFYLTVLIYELLTLLFTFISFVLEKAAISREKKLEENPRHMIWKVFFEHLIIEESVVFIQLNLTFSIVMAILFSLVQGVGNSWPFIVISLVVFICWLFLFPRNKLFKEMT